MNISKQVLLLQGPVGPFFDRLHSRLLENQVNCTRILFNAGDKLFCQNKQSALSFEGNLEEWGTWFKKYIYDNKPSVVVLFGADRPIHSIARDICNMYGIRVLCLEEGYFRPGFITFEEGGNNASSPLANKLPPPDFNFSLEDFETNKNYIISKNSFRNKCWYGFLYYFRSQLWTASVQRKLFHKSLNLFQQAYFWPKNLFYWFKLRRSDINLFKDLLSQNYYVVALQLDADMQSRFQSNGWKKIDLIRETIESFVKKASFDCNLVFKVHPLERGHYDHSRIIKEFAIKYGIEKRVFTIQTGSIGRWLKFSKGMITINSTSGFSAIYHGIPILLCGNALYKNENLVYKLKNKSDLDNFWYEEVKATKAERLRYLGWIRNESCVNGDFYTKVGREDAIKNIIEIIFNPRHSDNLGISAYD